MSDNTDEISNDDSLPEFERPSLDFNVRVGLMCLDLRLPNTVRSLKMKRGALAKMTTHIRKTWPVSLAEVEHHDIWDRVGLAVVLVSSDQAVVNRTLESIVSWIESSGEAEVIGYSTENL